MKKITITLTLLVALLLSACAGIHTPEIDYDYEETLFFGEQPQILVEESFTRRPFEDILAFSTDVVIAHFVGQRAFNSYTFELEFEVSEKIYGNAADRIFVYLEYGRTKFSDNFSPFWEAYFLQNGYKGNNVYSQECLAKIPRTEVIFHPFEEGVNYLLALYASTLNRVTATTRGGFNRPQNGDDRNRAFFLINDIVINLDDITQSTIDNQPFCDHILTSHLGLADRSSTVEDMIEFVYKQAQNPAPMPPWDITNISSSSIEDIINGSPRIVVVDVGALNSERSARGNWHYGDWRNATVVQSLKGEIEVGSEIGISFLPDTVSYGDRVIVTLCGTFFTVSARNSVFPMEYEQRIGEILGIR